MQPHESSLFGCLRLCAIVTFVLLSLGAASALVAWRVHEHRETQRGRTLVVTYGCTSCHEIPGTGPSGIVGPSLAHIGTRSYLAGRLPNVPTVMETWIQHPQELKRGTVMPDLGVSDRDARDIAAYLATLK